MIFNLVDTFIESKFDSLNGYLDTNIKIRKVRSSSDLDKISAGESNIAYTVNVSFDVPDDEDRTHINADVKILFKIMNINKTSNIISDVSDRYLTAMLRILKQQIYYTDSDISDGLVITGLSNLKIEETDRTEFGYYFPVISFNLKIADYIQNIIYHSNSN